MCSEFNINMKCARCGANAGSVSINRFVNHLYETVAFTCGAKQVVKYSEDIIDGEIQLVVDESCQSKQEIPNLTLLDIKDKYGNETFERILNLLQ